MFLFLILRHSQAPPLHTKAQLPLRPTLALYLPAGRFPKTRRMLWGHSGAARAKCVRTAVTSSHHRHETLTLLPQRVSEGPKTGTPCPTAQASNPLQPGPSHSPETPAHLSRIESPRAQLCLGGPWMPGVLPRETTVQATVGQSQAPSIHLQCPQESHHPGLLGAAGWKLVWACPVQWCRPCSVTTGSKWGRRFFTGFLGSEDGRDAACIMHLSQWA